MQGIDTQPQAPTPARWPNETARHGNITTTQTPHTPWPYGIACHTCHHTSVHATPADATTAARAHTCTAPLPQTGQAALARLNKALSPEATR